MQLIFTDVCFRGFGAAQQGGLGAPEGRHYSRDAGSASSERWTAPRTLPGDQGSGGSGGGALGIASFPKRLAVSTRRETPMGARLWAKPARVPNWRCADGTRAWRLEAGTGGSGACSIRGLLIGHKRGGRCAAADLRANRTWIAKEGFGRGGAWASFRAPRVEASTQVRDAAGGGSNYISQPPLLRQCHSRPGKAPNPRTR